MTGADTLREHLADPLHRNAWLLTANSASGAALGFVFWLVAARLASPAVVGAGAALISAATLAALLGKFGLDAALVRFAPGAHRRARRGLLLNAVAASAVASGAGALALLASGARLAGDVPALTGGEEAAFVAFAAFLAVAWVLDAYFLAERRAGLSLARNLVHHTVRVVLALAVFLVTTPFGILAAWGLGLAASLATGLLLARPLLATAPPEGEGVPPRGLLARYAAANYAVNVSEWLPALALPLLVFASLGAESNALFYVAWTLASLGFLASKAVAQSAFAEMSARRPRGEVLRRATRHQILVLAPLGLALLAAGELALRAFGPGYALAAPLLSVLAASLPFVAVVNLRLALLKHQAGEAGAVPASAELVLLPLLLVVAVLASAPFLLSSYGILGAGVAWLVANAAAAAWSLAARRPSRRAEPAAPALGVAP